MSSMTIAAPDGASTYSYSRTTFGSSSEARTAASCRNSSLNSGSDSRLCRRYLIATRVPDASCRASATSPNPPEPSARNLVNPGTSHSVTRIHPLASAVDSDVRGIRPGVRTEDGQRDHLRRAAVALALNGDGHIHGVLPGHHGLVQRLWGLSLRPEHPLIGDRSCRAIGGDPPGHVDRA